MPSKKKRYTFTFNGKRYSVFASSAKDAGIKMAEKQKELKEGVRLSGGAMPFRSWAQQYMEVYKAGSLKPKTYQSYMYIVEQLNKRIGDLPLKSIAPMDCQRTINTFAGKSRRYIRIVCWLLHEILQSAVDNRKIQDNPAVNIALPSGYLHSRYNGPIGLDRYSENYREHGRITVEERSICHGTKDELQPRL